MRREVREYLGFRPSVAAKLNQNEVPLQPPEWLFRDLDRVGSTLNYYQTSWLYNEVRKAYAEYAGVDEWKRVWAAPGADLFYDELFIHSMVRRRCVAPRPTYFVFEMQAEHVGCEIVGPRLSPPEWRLDTRGIGLLAGDSDFIYIDNPNNPTGALILDERGAQEILGLGIPVLVDEAYYEFSGRTLADMIYEHENLAVLRTMSKAFRLAGLRVTFLLVGDGYLKMMHKATVMFRIPTLSLVIALRALRNPDYVEETVRYVVEERERLARGLERLGLEVYPSHTNYILVKHGGEVDVAGKLRERGVLVRDVSSQLGPGYVRISVGSREENDLLLDALREILG